MKRVLLLLMLAAPAAGQPTAILPLSEREAGTWELDCVRDELTGENLLCYIRSASYLAASDRLESSRRFSDPNPWFNPDIVHKATLSVDCRGSVSATAFAMKELPSDETSMEDYLERFPLRERQVELEKIRLGIRSWSPLPEFMAVERWSMNSETGYPETGNRLFVSRDGSWLGTTLAFSASTDDGARWPASAIWRIRFGDADMSTVRDFLAGSVCASLEGEP